MAAAVATREFVTLAICATVFIFTPAAYAQDSAPLSKVKVTVLDPSGAVVPDSEVAFKSESTTVVSHTGPVGSVTVMLPSGRYTVTTTHYGFLKSELSDVQVEAGKPRQLSVVMKVGYGKLIVDGPVPPVFTITSNLSSLIPPVPEPKALPPVLPAPKKIRSLRCLYLWKCLTS